MAKMHSDGRGQSGSSKPVNRKVPRWVEYDEEEVEDLVLKLRDKGLSPSEIGIRLRDEYGIPSVKEITGKKMSKILEENDSAPEIPEDLQNLVEKAESIREHIEENPNDGQAERQLELTESKIRRVADYHREEGNIPGDWKYIREE